MQEQERPQSLPAGLTEIVTTKEPIDEGTRRWQLTGIDIIEDIRNRLKGRIYNIEKGEWTKTSEPIMNDWGIGKIVNILSWYLNKNMQLSYFEPEQIEKLLINFEREISFFIESYRVKMELTKENARMIAVMISDTVWAGVERARYGGEKQFIENTEQRRILQTEGEKKPDTVWDKIPLIGGRK